MKSNRVLVVEDDADIRESLVEVLATHGFAASGASDGSVALTRLRQAASPPSLILLDLMMPVMDGRAFREEQLKHPHLKDIPVVVISAYRDIVDDATEMAVSGHLKKPLDLEELLRVVERYCAA